MKNSPFIDFWRAVNLQLASMNLQPITFGPARDLWDQTMGVAAADSTRAQLQRWIDQEARRVAALGIIAEDASLENVEKIGGTDVKH
jgi:hypothetical protein